MSDERLLAFTRAFADSIRSGLPSVLTLRELAGAHGRKLDAAALLVEKGEPLHAALAAQDLLPNLLLAMIRAGEESGKLDAFLDRYAAALEAKIDFRRRINRALVYPAFAAFLAGVIFLLFSTKAAPMLLEPMIEAGVAVPPEAFKIIRVGGFIVKNWLLILGGVLAGYFFLRALIFSTPGRMAWALAGHGFPGVRFATEHARHYQFEATLELLLAAGLRPRQIMEILLESFRHDLITRRRLTRGAVMLAEGKTFVESVGDCVPAQDRSRFLVAEKAGQLDEALKKLALGHRDQQLHRLKLTATAVQLAALVMLAPICFALLMAIAGPSLASLGPAINQLTGGEIATPPSGAASPKLQTGPRALSAPRVERNSPAGSFNEENAKKVVGFMQTHKAPAESAGAQASPAPKALKLRPRKQLKRPQSTPLAPTTIQSFE